MIVDVKLVEKLLSDYLKAHEIRDIHNIEYKDNCMVTIVTCGESCNGHERHEIHMLEIMAWVYSQTKRK